MYLVLMFIKNDMNSILQLRIKQLQVILSKSLICNSNATFIMHTM